MRNLFLLIFIFCTATSTAQDSMWLSPEVRDWYRNPDGSCVQCSIGMCGCHTNDNNAATLLWDTEYGSKVRGGSWPGRVTNYANQRGLRLWNVTTDNWEDMREWLVWCCKTGRFAAIGAGTAHFQTLYAYVPDQDKPWGVCNNNSPKRVDWYSENDFRRLHEQSGYWCVILKSSASDTPVFRNWWD